MDQPARRRSSGKRQQAGSTSLVPSTHEARCQTQDPKSVQHSAIHPWHWAEQTPARGWYAMLS